MRRGTARLVVKPGDAIPNRLIKSSNTVILGLNEEIAV
jgi:hypothetical protein